MKRNKNRYIVSVFFIVCMFLGGMQHVSAQQTLSQSGTWTNTIVNTQTVDLSGNVTINGQITIPNGVKLTIIGNNKMLQRSTTHWGHLFNIQPGGELVIEKAIIDGNNNWTGGSVDTRPTSNGVKATGSFINLSKVGNITLTDVTLQNGWMVTQEELDGKVWENTEENKTVSLRSSGTGIYIGGGAKEDAYTNKVNFTMTNCTIQRLYSTYNGPIFVNRTSAGSNVEITNCHFKNNVVWYPEDNVGTYKDGNQGGILRTQGGTNADATISGGSFENNISNGQAGAIYWNAGLGSLTVKKNVQFINNKAGSYGGAMMVMTAVKLESATMNGNQAKYGGGLAYRPFNSGSSAASYTTEGTEDGTPFEQLTKADMTLTDAVTITGNTATNGGGIFIESGNIRFSTMAGDEDGETDNVNGTFRDDPASMVLTINGATIQYNEANDGGGIYMQSVKYGASDVDKGTQSGLKLLSGTIQNNTATNNGGGVYLKGIPINFEGDGKKTVASNEANGSGGGIYIDNTVKLLSQDLDVNLTKATISGNKAGSQGGGVYVTGSENVVAKVNLEGITMTTNTATDSGGGLYLNGGDLNINGTGNTIQANNALNGGGVCLEDGELAINQCYIRDNSATNLGGGLFVANDNHVEIELTGSGIFEKNTAVKAGGGMAMQGPITLTFSGSLQNNTAGNGGGIYLSNTEGASQKTLLDFTDGFIRYNIANGTGNSAKTGYQQSVDALKGFGGGAFLDSNTELTFNLDSEGYLGFYGNLAENCADDIFANSNGTSVVLPSVKDMELSDFDVPTTELYWVEDYIPGDKDNYEAYGSNMIAKSENTDDDVRRYRESLKQSKAIYKVTDEYFEEVKNKYLCLALGYKILYLTIKKIGLHHDESAVFNVFDNNDNLVSTALLRGNQNKIASGVIQRVAVPEGTYKVKENNWSWNYKLLEVTVDGKPIEEPQDKKYPIEIREVNSDAKNTITFTNTIDNPNKGKYDEAIIENTMGGTSTTAQ